MKITVLCGPNNGAIYIEGSYEASHDSLQRGCRLEDVEKALDQRIDLDHDTIKYIDIAVGDEPYLDDHGCFPQNVKLLVGNYWSRGE